MIIECSYAEMAFLRELVNKEKLRIWHEIWLPRIKNPDKAIEYFEEWDREIFDGIPLTNLDCCRILQSRFEKIEKRIQLDLTTT